MQIVALITALLILVYVWASSPLRGLSRFLAPDIIAVVMLVAIFGVRPLFKDRFETGARYDVYVPTQRGGNVALIVGMLALLGLSIGIFLMRVTPKRYLFLTKPSATSVTNNANFSPIRVLGIMTASVLVYVFLLTALAGPGIRQQLNAGRSASLELGGVPKIVTLIPMVGPIAGGLFFLVNRTRKLSRPEIRLVPLSVAISVALLSQLGNRRFIIPAALIPLIAALIRKPVLLKLWHVMCGLVGMLFIAIVPMVRAAGARRPGEGLLSAAFRYLQEEGIVGVLRPIFVSFDTEMFDHIAVASSTFQDNSFRYGRGTILEFILRPLAGSVTGGTSWSDSVLTRLFGGGCGEPHCPVASIPGVLYFDGGIFAVFFGSVAAGAILRQPTNMWKFNAGHKVSYLLVMMIFSSFALVTALKNTVHALWSAIYMVILGLIVYLFTGKIPHKRMNKNVQPNRIHKS